MRLILINGAPRSGKDTAGKAICASVSAWAAHRGHGQMVAMYGMSWHLKEATHTLYGHPGRRHDYYEQVKDLSHIDFFGLSPRQAYIDVSEKDMKPRHGKDVFGRIYLRRIAPLDADVIVSADAGFEPEWQPVIAKYGAENLFLIRVHAEGRGRTFAGDSRSYITLPGVRTVDLDNNTRGDWEKFTQAAVGAVCSWLKI